MNFSVLPSMVALAILVVVFGAILRQETSERLHLWLAGWILVLLHFVAQFLDHGTIGLKHNVLDALVVDGLVLAAIAFLVSVSPAADSRNRAALLATALGLPALIFCNAAIWGVVSQGFYYLVIALALLGTVGLLWKTFDRVTPYAVGLLIAALAVAGSLVWAVERKSFNDAGVSFILAALNFFAAVLYWRHFRRFSAGVLTTVFGFAAWGSVFPIGMLFDAFAPAVHVESEVWNIPKYFVAVGMILTLFEQQIEKSDYLAYHDALTGLPNRRLLEDRLEQALNRADRSGAKVAVLLLDLDHFKEVNDNYGHRVGDLALQQVVQRLSSRMRASDTLARSGGDEFTIVSDVADNDGAQILVDDLERAVAQPFLLEGHLIQAGLSIGVALYPDNGETADELRAVADKAMYAAKRNGRAQIHLSPLPDFSA